MPVFLSEALQCAAFGVVFAIVLEGIACALAALPPPAPEKKKEDEE